MDFPSGLLTVPGRTFLHFLAYLGQLTALMQELLIAFRSGVWRLRLVAQQIVAKSLTVRATEKAIDTVVAQWFGDWTDTFSTEVKVSSRNYSSAPALNANTPEVSLVYSGTAPAGTATGDRTAGATGLTAAARAARLRIWAILYRTTAVTWSITLTAYWHGTKPHKRTNRLIAPSPPTST